MLDATAAEICLKYVYSISTVLTNRELTVSEDNDFIDETFGGAAATGARRTPRAQALLRARVLSVSTAPSR